MPRHKPWHAQAYPLACLGMLGGTRRCDLLPPALAVTCCRQLWVGISRGPGHLPCTEQLDGYLSTPPVLTTLFCPAEEIYKENRVPLNSRSKTHHRQFATDDLRSTPHHRICRNRKLVITTPSQPHQKSSKPHDIILIFSARDPRLLQNMEFRHGF